MFIEFKKIKIYSDSVKTLYFTVESLTRLMRKVPELKKLENLILYVGNPRNMLHDLRKELSSKGLNLLQQELEIRGLSLSFRDKENEIVLVNLEDATLTGAEGSKESWMKSFTGVLAHEIIHSIQRELGFEELMNKALEETYYILEEIMESEKLKTPEFKKSFLEFVKTALLSLKDLAVNTYMIDCSLKDECLAYQFEDFKKGKGELKPQFYDFKPGKKPKKEEILKILEALEFEIMLLPSWLPFSIEASSYAEKLLQTLNLYYRSSTKNIALQMGFIEPFYLYSFSYSENFYKKYFYFLYSLLYEIITGKPFFVLHIADAFKVFEEEPFENKETVESTLLKSAYLGLQNDARHSEEFKIVEEELKQKLSAAEWEEWIEIKNKYTPSDLIKLPVLILINEGMKKLLSNKKTHLIQAALSLSLTGAFIYNNEVFKKVAEHLKFKEVPKNIWDAVTNLLLAYTFLSTNIHGEKFRKRHVVQLVESLRKFKVPPSYPNLKFAFEVFWEAKKPKKSIEKFTQVIIHLAQVYGVKVELHPTVFAALLAANWETDDIKKVILGI